MGAGEVSTQKRPTTQAGSPAGKTFSKYGMDATFVLDLRGQDKPAAERALKTNWRCILHFLNAYVKKDQASLAFLRRKPEENGLPADFPTVEIKEAVKPAPAPWEFLSVIKQSGLPRAARIDALRAARPRLCLRPAQG
jgi:hypothetical protein